MAKAWIKDGKAAAIAPNGTPEWVPVNEWPSYARRGYTPETYQESQAREKAEQVAVQSDNPGLAALAGIARGATLGLSDVALTGSGLVERETLANLQAANPAASTAGNIAGAVGLSLIPGLAPASLGGLAAAGAAQGVGQGVSDIALRSPEASQGRSVADEVADLAIAGTVGAAASAGLGLAAMGVRSLTKYATGGLRKAATKATSAPAAEMAPGPTGAPLTAEDLYSVPGLARGEIPTLAEIPGAKAASGSRGLREVLQGEAQGRAKDYVQQGVMDLLGGVVPGLGAGGILRKPVQQAFAKFVVPATAGAAKAATKAARVAGPRVAVLTGAEVGQMANEVAALDPETVRQQTLAGLQDAAGVPDSLKESIAERNGTALSMLQDEVARAGIAHPSLPVKGQHQPQIPLDRRVRLTNVTRAIMDPSSAIEDLMAGRITEEAREVLLRVYGRDLQSVLLYANHELDKAQAPGSNKVFSAAQAHAVARLMGMRGPMDPEPERQLAAAAQQQQQQSPGGGASPQAERPLRQLSGRTRFSTMISSTFGSPTRGGL